MHKTTIALLFGLAFTACADLNTADPTPQPDACTEASGGYPCSGIDLLGFLSVIELGGSPGGTVSDIWGWTDPETDREYALVGRSDGTAFVDVTDPEEPRLVGSLPQTTGAHPSPWRDIKVYTDHAFIVADNAGPHGMQVFDLRRLRGLTGDPELFDSDFVYGEITSAHNIVIDEAAGLAVIVGARTGGQTCGGGLHMVDVTTPAAPAFIGCFNDPTTGRGSGYTHDAQCVTYAGPDTRYTGRQICLGSNQDKLSVADVTDPENAVALAASGYPAAAYLHQGWLTDDHRFFYMDDEADEFNGIGRTRTLVWDLDQLDDPVLVNEHAGVEGSTDHNLFVRGDRLYQANYRSGLRVLDISDRANPVEVGYFDTTPGLSGPGFDGAWSVYPWFESGTLIVTSIDEGLFVLRAAADSGV